MFSVSLYVSNVWSVEQLKSSPERHQLSILKPFSFYNNYYNTSTFLLWPCLGKWWGSVKLVVQWVWVWNTPGRATPAMSCQAPLIDGQKVKSQAVLNHYLYIIKLLESRIALKLVWHAIWFDILHLNDNGHASRVIGKVTAVSIWSNHRLCLYILHYTLWLFIACDQSSTQNCWCLILWSACKLTLC